MASKLFYSLYEMVKSAGIFKKLKNIFSKGAKWINNNIVKPLNPIIDTALDFVPGGNIIRNVKDGASKFIDKLPGQDYQNERVQRIVAQGADMLMDTQRAPKDKKYNFGYTEYSDDEYEVPQNTYGEASGRSPYTNPFGKRIN